MELAAVVAEYNPFHNGHAYQLSEIRRNGGTHVAVVMSGNVVQRGEVACFSKAVRARAALLGGADLVLELPASFACASAERFAGGAIRTFAGLGLPGTLWFGSECGDTEALCRCAEALNETDGSETLKTYLERGLSFPDARSRAVAELAGEETAALLKNPNDTLGIEYIRAISRYQAPFAPKTIRRVGAEHDSLRSGENFASATLLRQLCREGQLSKLREWVPETVFSLYRKDWEEHRGGTDTKNLEAAVLYHLKALSPEKLRGLPDVEPGLEHRLWNAVLKASSLEELFFSVRSRRYPLSRVRRAVMHAMLGIDRELAGKAPSYLRVLAFNERGQEILKAARKTAALPLFHSFAKIEKEYPEFARRERLASDLFSLALPVPRKMFSEYEDLHPGFFP